MKANGVVAPASGKTLNPLMKELLWLWKAELGRISKLQWWEQLTAVESFPKEPTPLHFHPVGLIGNFLASDCIPLPKAQFIALSITSGFEGGKPMNYKAVAGNFDGMGISYGLIQWNAGSGTLGPLLSKMKDADPVSFKNSFPASGNYDQFINALNGGNASLMSWALSFQSSTAGWKIFFEKLGDAPTFQQIQVEVASAQRHALVIPMVNFLRGLSPDLMNTVKLQTYCAFFDLAVQQQTLDSARTAIIERVAREHPATQEALVRIAVEERALTAQHQWVSDCMSRRVGILQHQTYTYTANGITQSRDNRNYQLLAKDGHANVCKI